MPNMLSIMLQAEGAEYGVEVSTNDSALFQRKFYATRAKQKKAGDTTFESLSCRIINPTTVYLFKTPKEEDWDE